MSVVCGKVPFNVAKLFQVWLILLTFTSIMSEPNSDRIPRKIESNQIPEFDDITTRIIQAVEGQTLLLPCTVRNLGEKVVSWIRSKDLHILTSGPFQFSGDNRFEPVPSLAGDFWGLRIRKVNRSDSGQYECQVNTDPKKSLFVNLSVSAVDDGANSRWIGRAVIKGPSQVYVVDGSPVTLTCEISPLLVASPQSGQHTIFMTSKPKLRWLHDNKEILSTKYQSHFSTDTLYSEVSQKVIGVLKIKEASWRDSGQYTCFQMSVKSDSVNLSVMRDESEHFEAMQRDYAQSSAPHLFLSEIVFIFPHVFKIIVVLLCK